MASPHDISLAGFDSCLSLVYFICGLSFWLFDSEQLFLWFVQNPASVSLSVLKNYFDIFKDPRFITALRNTLLYALLKTGLVVFIGVLLAKTLFAIKFGSRVYVFNIFTIIMLCGGHRSFLPTSTNPNLDYLMPTQ